MGVQEKVLGLFRFKQNNERIVKTKQELISECCQRIRTKCTQALVKKFGQEALSVKGKYYLDTPSWGNPCPAFSCRITAYGSLMDPDRIEVHELVHSGETFVPLLVLEQGLGKSSRRYVKTRPSEDDYTRPLDSVSVSDWEKNIGRAISHWEKFRAK